MQVNTNIDKSFGRQLREIGSTLGSLQPTADANLYGIITYVEPAKKSLFGYRDYVLSLRIMDPTGEISLSIFNKDRSELPQVDERSIGDAFVAKHMVVGSFPWGLQAKLKKTGSEFAPVSMSQQRLIEDEIRADLINPALAGDSEAIGETGRQYLDKKQYGEAMKWFRLAAAKNNSGAQNDIGVMYYKGLGVPTDHITALERLLKAAVQEHKEAYKNIGNLFENGVGVPVDKYKAIEWYIKCDNIQDKVKELSEQGFQLLEKDKGKGVENLIIEAENKLGDARTDVERKGEIESLKREINQLEKKLNDINDESIPLKDEIKKVEEAIAHEDDQLDNFLRVEIEKFEENEEKIKALEEKLKSQTDESEFLKNVISKRRKLQ